eukprot:g1402.t1
MSDLPDYHFKRRGAAAKIEYSTRERKKSVVTARRRTWVNDASVKVCPKCSISFDWLVRKHHCRKCGGVFCDSCSKKKVVLPGSGSTKPVRCCDDCYDTMTSGGGAPQAAASKARGETART